MPLAPVVLEEIAEFISHPALEIGELVAGLEREAGWRVADALEFVTGTANAVSWVVHDVPISVTMALVKGSQIGYNVFHAMDRGP